MGISKEDKNDYNFMSTRNIATRWSIYNFMYTRPDLRCIELSMQFFIDNKMQGGKKHEWELERASLLWLEGM